MGVEAIVTSSSTRVALATDVIDAIITRTDSVPLFVEELTKAILETSETTIPASLVAGLDRFPEVREVAQIRGLHRPRVRSLPPGRDRGSV